MNELDLPVLPPLLLTARLYVPADLRSAYRQCGRDLVSACGGGLLAVELWEDAARPGFFLECLHFRDEAAWSAAREGADARLAPIFERRRTLIPDRCEEVSLYFAA